MAEPAAGNMRQLKDLPALRQLFMLAGVALAVAAGFWTFSWR